MFVEGKMMVVQDFLKLLKDVAEGNLTAWQSLQQYIQEEAFSPLEIEQAHIFFKKIGNKHPSATYALAHFYEIGFGVKPDLEMAFLLVREAAGHGHTESIYEVGRRFYYGIGIEQNYTNALQWLVLAASSPHYHPAAMYHVGLIYQQGLGILSDPEQASDWFNQSLARGFDPNTIRKA